jgi:hypothetical protein
MSLTGHIDVFPLEEVLRLLARSYKSGCLRVDAPDLHGRVFMSGGSVTFATVGSDEDLRRILVNSKVVSEDSIRAAEVGGRSLSESAAPSGLSDFFREEVIESLFRIRKPGRGQFVFNVDVTPRYRSEQAFDVEMCISEADRRAAEWADIESVIATIDEGLRVVSEAPNNEPVTLAPNTWKLVANFEGTSSVRVLADRLGTSRFRAAKDLAALARAGLVEAVRSPEPASAPPTPSYSYAGYETSVAPEPSEPLEPTEPDSSYGEGYGEPEPERSEPERAEPKEADFNRSWWAEAVPAEASSEEAPVEREGEDEDETAETPAGSDSFLDRVFSQLNENPEGQGGTSQVPSHGFLKRRRMSSVGLDD